MKTRNGWYQGFWPLALLAVLAFFVSPSLAFSCGCAPAKKHTVMARMDMAKMEAGNCPCCQKSLSTGISRTAKHHVVSQLCSCSIGQAPLTLSSSAYGHGVLTSPATLPVDSFSLATPPQRLVARFIHAAAQPRSPSLRSPGGRSPPIFSL